MFLPTAIRNALSPAHVPQSIYRLTKFPLARSIGLQELEHKFHKSTIFRLSFGEVCSPWNTHEKAWSRLAWHLIPPLYQEDHFFFLSFSIHKLYTPLFSLNTEYKPLFLSQFTMMPPQITSMTKIRKFIRLKMNADVNSFSFIFSL